MERKIKQKTKKVEKKLLQVCIVIRWCVCPNISLIFSARLEPTPRVESCKATFVETLTQNLAAKFKRFPELNLSV
jgi:hypothetical protein